MNLIEIRHDRGPTLSTYPDFENLGWKLISTIHPSELLVMSSSDFQKRILQADLIFAAPPCHTFSLQAVRTHWDFNLPKTEEARVSLRIALQIAKNLLSSDIPWFYENPQGMLRQLLKYHLPEFPESQRITYCQYGCERMKPTLIWTNTKIKLLPPCKNGDPCHIRSPRGSRSGTQGLPRSLKALFPTNLQKTLLDYTKEEHEHRTLLAKQ